MICTATKFPGKLPADDEMRRPCHLALARIGVSLPLEVPIYMATLHKFARDSAHKADDDFQALG